MAGIVRTVVGLHFQDRYAGLLQDFFYLIVFYRVRVAEGEDVAIDPSAR